MDDSGLASVNAVIPAHPEVDYGAHTAWIAAGFLIECMQEVDQVHQFLADIRGNSGARHGAAAA